MATKYFISFILIFIFYFLFIYLLIYDFYLHISWICLFLNKMYQILNRNSKISTIIINITHFLDISLVNFMVEILICITMIKKKKWKIKAISDLSATICSELLYFFFMQIFKLKHVMNIHKYLIWYYNVALIRGQYYFQMALKVHS